VDVCLAPFFDESVDVCLAPFFDESVDVPGCQSVSTWLQVIIIHLVASQLNFRYYMSLWYIVTGRNVIDVSNNLFTYVVVAIVKSNSVVSSGESVDCKYCYWSQCYRCI